MLISEVIEELANTLTTFGNLDCYISVRNGGTNVSAITKKDIQAGSACDVLHFNDAVKNDDGHLCYIGED